MLHQLFQALWILCGLAGLVLAGRLLRLRAWKRMPWLTVWALLTGVEYLASYLINQHSWRSYVVIWPYREAFDTVLLAVTATEIFRRSSEIRGIGIVRRWLFNITLGLGFIAGIFAAALGRVESNRVISMTLIASHAAGIALAVFIAAFLVFFKIAGQSQYPNLAIHARMMVGYLALWSASRIAINYVSASQYANVASLLGFSVLFVAWAVRLKRAGENKVELAPRVADGPAPKDIADSMRVLVREIREGQRAS